MEINFTDGSKSIINKIFCLGLNYADHISEMSHKKPAQPVIFIKPLTAICYNDDTVEIPELSQRMDYEVEMVIYLKSGGKKLNLQEAGECIGAYGVGIDLTLRDLQKKAKEKGLPWSVAKGFDKSAPISDFIKTDSEVVLNNLNLSLWVNNELKQESNTSLMLFKPSEMISYISHFFSLTEGDIIFTGTPSGIGKLNSGDTVKAKIDGDLELLVNIL